MLRIPRAVLEEVHAHARAAAPEEACGILAGRSEGAAHIVARAIPVRNAHERPRAAYRLDPAEMLRAVLRIEDELALAVVGFYHSHPAGPEGFSVTDRAEASWPGASYLLVSLAPRFAVASAQCVAPGSLDPEPVEITSTDSVPRGL